MGKQVTITTDKATIVVVDFPREKGKAMAAALLCNPNFGKKEFSGYSPLGQVDEITEDVWSSIIDFKVEFDINEPEPSTTSRQMEIVYFKDYLNDDFFGDCTTAIESGLSLLKANGVVLQNTKSIEPSKNNYVGVGGYNLGKHASDWVDWKETQENVWLNPYIFLAP